MQNADLPKVEPFVGHLVNLSSQLVAEFKSAIDKNAAPAVGDGDSKGITGASKIRKYLEKHND